MKPHYLFKLFLLLFFKITFSEQINNAFFTSEGVYLIKKTSIFFKTNNLYFRRPLFQEFKIYKADTEDNYYYIEDKKFRKKLGNKEIGGIKPIFLNETDLKINKDYALWKLTSYLTKNNTLVYTIQNKFNKMFLNLFENNSALNNTEFQIIRSYIEKNDTNSSLLDKEPIDVLIKYIDLYDQNLNRANIKQIRKDIDNNELKYCLRSILKNIPWIRKIFILMPNEKVFFLKEQNEISEKIVYIKDKDLLGFDSSSSPVFQFNLFKMRKFNLSENFILMDDDYFIGKPLLKSDFFYEENGKIFPLLITNNFYPINKNDLEEYFIKHPDIYQNESHSQNGYQFQVKSSLLFLYKIFGDDITRNNTPLIEPVFSHNAIPLKLSDIEEVYNYIEKLYKYKDETLRGLFRDIHSLQPQTLFQCYAKNKYDRFVKAIDSEYYSLSNMKRLKRSNFCSLFTINTSDYKYYLKMLKVEIFTLIKLFPEKTKYEKILEEDENEKEIIKQINEGKSDFEELSKLIKIKFNKSKFIINETNKIEIKKGSKKSLLDYIIVLICIKIIIIILIIKKIKSSKELNNFITLEVIYETPTA